MNLDANTDGPKVSEMYYGQSARAWQCVIIRDKLWVAPVVGLLGSQGEEKRYDEMRPASQGRLFCWCPQRVSFAPLRQHCSSHQVGQTVCQRQPCWTAGAETQMTTGVDDQRRARRGRD